AVLKDPALTGWMLKTTAEDEQLIRERIAKLQSRNPISAPVSNWPEHLASPEGSKLPPGVAGAVQENQAEVLAHLVARPVSVLTGGAGTGKTTVLATLIKGLRRRE